MKNQILGKWFQLQERAGERGQVKIHTLGVGVDTYFADGTRIGEVRLSDGQVNREIKKLTINYRWRIVQDNLLIEEVVSIDKGGIKLPKEYKKIIKKGRRFYSRIIELTKDKLVLRPEDKDVLALKNEGITESHEVIMVRKYNCELHS